MSAERTEEFEELRRAIEEGDVDVLRLWDLYKEQLEENRRLREAIEYCEGMCFKRVNKR